MFCKEGAGLQLLGVDSLDFVFLQKEKENLFETAKLSWLGYYQIWAENVLKSLNVTFLFIIWRQTTAIISPSTQYDRLCWHSTSCKHIPHKWTYYGLHWDDSCTQGWAGAGSFCPVNLCAFNVPKFQIRKWIIKGVEHLSFEHFD